MSFKKICNDTQRGRIKEEDNITKVRQVRYVLPETLVEIPLHDESSITGKRRDCSVTTDNVPSILRREATSKVVERPLVRLTVGESCTH